MVPELCASRVLTMEYVPGVKISDKAALDARGFDAAQLSTRLTTSYLDQLCRHGFFHCDPHPGNLAVDDGYPGGRLIYYDFGMMEAVDPDVKKALVDLTYATYKNLPIDAADALETMGVPRQPRPLLNRADRENMLNQFEATLGKGEPRGERDERRGAEAGRRERRAKLGQDLFATQVERPSSSRQSSPSSSAPSARSTASGRA